VWQYQHTLVGRGLFNDEREDEVEERGKTAPAKKSLVPESSEFNEHQYEKDMDEAFEYMRSNAAAAVPEGVVLDFEEFWATAWSYGTSGFAARSRTTVNIKKRGQPDSKYKIRLTKKGAISQLTKEEFRAQLEADGLCTSTGSLKFEEAATRTLFASDVIHYLISAWVTDKLEKVIYDGNFSVTDLGLRALAELRHMMGLAGKMSQFLWGWAYDFRNFNIQHLNRDMRRYYVLVSAVGHEKEVMPSWLRGITWLINAVDNTWIRADGSKPWTLALHGLLSGIRATQGINTCLNIAYLYVINKCVDRLLPSSATLECLSHGDDVSAVVDAWERGILLYYCAEECGFIAQQLKVTLEQGRTQYLRIGYDSDGGAYGYLARAIARFVSTEWKPRYGSLLSDRLQELNQQCALIRRRGASGPMVRGIFEEMRQYYAGEGSELPGRVGLSDELTHASVECNGAGIIQLDDERQPVYQVIDGLPRTPQIPPPKEVGSIISQMPRAAVWRYWHHLEAQYPRFAVLHNKRTREREVDRVHIGDCIAQLPKALQHLDKHQRNIAYAKWVRKWNRGFNFKKMLANRGQMVSKPSITPMNLETMKSMAQEDLELLDAMNTGYSVPFDTASHYDRLSGAIAHAGIRIESFVTSAVKRLGKEEQYALIAALIEDNTGGYLPEDVVKIVLDGHQFNSLFGKALPPQFASVVRKRALVRYEELSRNLTELRGIIFAYEVALTNAIFDHPRLSLLTHY
jgi:hypothetical protein